MTTIEKIYKISSTVFWVALVILIMAIFANLDFIEKAIKDSIENMARFKSVGNLLLAVTVLLKVIDIYDIALVIISGITTLIAYFWKYFHS